MRNLRSVRKECNLTQKQIAELLNISQQSYSDYENEKTQPDFETLIKMANALNVSIDYLLGRTDELGEVVAPASSPIGEQLTDNERTLLNWFRGLPSEKARASFLSFIDSSGNMFAAKKN